MISPNYVRQLAAYNAWQNDNQYAAVSGLSETERRHNRGAFFDPIQATLNHLIWADMMWKSRIAGTAMPVQVGVPIRCPVRGLDDRRGTRMHRRRGRTWARVCTARRKAQRAWTFRGRSV